MLGGFVYSWLFLITAIVFEVLGTLTMKYHIGDSPFVGLGIMYLMLTISYGTFAIAVKVIPLAVAYGIWESLGVVFIAIFTTLLFNEPMNLAKISGIFAIIVGIALLKFGTFESNENTT